MSDAHPAGRVVPCSCGKRLRVPADKVGRKARCPNCGAVLRIAPAEAVPPQPSTDRLKVRCKCGRKIAVPASAAGKRARCPACQAVFVVPTPKAEAPAALEETLAADSTDGVPAEGGDAAGDSSFSLLDDLLGEADAGVAVGTPPARAKRCPGCGAPMAESARVCVSCGYDTQKKQKHATLMEVPAPPVERARRGVRLTSWSGSFVLGLVLSGVGALLGAALWCGVAVSTMYESGYIALALGALAGAGMYLGHRRQNFLAGVTAALVAAGGIVAAKGMVFAYVQESNRGTIERMAATLDDSDARQQKINALVEYHIERQSTLMGLSPGSMQRDAIYVQAVEYYTSMSEADLDQETLKMNHWEGGLKFEDEKYVRSALILCRIRERAMAEEQHDWEAYAAVHWGRLYHECMQPVEPMLHAQRVEDLKRCEALFARADKVQRLVAHTGERRAEQAGLSWADERRETIHDEELERVHRLSDEELAAEIAALDAWEAGGKWSDEAAVRNMLIYDRVDAALAAEAYDDEDEAEWDEAAAEERWRAAYVQAADEVDKLSNGERLAAAKALEVEQEERVDRMVREMRDALVAEAEEESAGYIKSNLFSLADIVFGMLALGAAFGIANGGARD